MADLNAEYTKRNAEIAARLDAGESRKSVAEAFELTKERIKQIHATVKRRRIAAETKQLKLAGQMTVDELELSIRTANILKNAGIMTVSELREMTDGQLLRLPNCGRKSLNELRAVTGPGMDEKTQRKMDKDDCRIAELEFKVSNLETFVDDLLSSRIQMMDRMSELAAAVEKLKP